MGKGNIVSLEDRIPKLKEQRKRKTNRRLILLLSLFFLLILTIVYFQSPLSRVHGIMVEGNTAVSKETILKAAGVTNNANIWSLDKKRIKSEVQKIPEIKTAAVKLNLPNRLVIHVKEYNKIAYVSKNSHFYPVLENGVILSDNSKTRLMNAPILTGFSQGKYLTDMVGQLKKLPSEILNSISEVHYAPDQTNKDHIILYMNDGFEVSAAIATLSDKIIHYPSIISQLNPNKKGIIDLEVGSYFQPYTENKDENK